jgi:hypothetical protein
MKLKKLDGRHNGYGVFTHYVDFPGDRMRKPFMEVRNWCVEQWGTSCEEDIWHDYPDLRNPHWCWERGSYNSVYKCRIYLVSEFESAWFLLKWS